MTNNIITRPSHYCEGRKYEPKDVIRDWGLNFNLGSAVKYISRSGRKDDLLTDLRKARQFLDFEIEAVEEERAASSGKKDSLFNHSFPCESDMVKDRRETIDCRDSGREQE